MAEAVTREWTFWDGGWIEGPARIATSRLHGLWMGSSVFDGARWYDGVAPDLDPHCARLNISADVMGLAPVLGAAEIADIAREGLRRYADRTALYIRPGYFAERGAASMVSPDAGSTQFCLTLFEAPMLPLRGGSLGLSPFRRPTPETMPTGAKAGCLYPNNARAVREAQRRGHDGAVMLDMLGHVAETATANLFLVRGGRVFTPAVNGTFLAGITRARVIALLRGDGVEVVEAALTVDDLARADEMFTTGNFSKVAPVERYETRIMGIGETTRRAHDLYHRWATTGPATGAAVALVGA